MVISQRVPYTILMVSHSIWVMKMSFYIQKSRQINFRVSYSITEWGLINGTTSGK
jgi:hypothetical protein